ncbi:hypothetical protein V5799_027915 [Amblyomma americanum]|uniref:Uncharacterized protein n=1 Tax=Amblyomma americanum TaxID=6943 RepID=A0AAQ4DEC3_AMBAM
MRQVSLEKATSPSLSSSKAGARKKTARTSSCCARATSARSLRLAGRTVIRSRKPEVTSLAQSGSAV